MSASAAMLDGVVPPVIRGSHEGVLDRLGACTPDIQGHVERCADAVLEEIKWGMPRATVEVAVKSAMASMFFDGLDYPTVRVKGTKTC
jgi:hypothetical protein